MKDASIRLMLIACVLLFCATASYAQQDYPKVDLAAAYTHNRVDAGTREGFNGFTAAVAGNPSSLFGIEGDLTYLTKSFDGARVNLFEYMGGPRLTFRHGKAEPFLHALVGGLHINGGGASDNGLSAKFGGGVDIIAGKHIAIRVAQVDYNPIHISGSGGVNHNISFTFGVRFF